MKPTAVAPGSGPFTLTVFGANFISGSVVNWNGQPRSTTFVSAHELQGKILATDVATNTAGTISVTNPPPGGGNSSAGWAQVEVHTPNSAIAVNPPYIVPSPYNFAYGFLMADFSGDNKLDAWADGILMLGNGNGKFHFGSTVPNFVYWDGAVYGDFNGDGKLDLAYVAGADIFGTNGKQVSIGLGDGKGKFTVASQIKGFAGYYAPVTGDFNGDGKLDLVLIQDKNILVFLGNGDGSFQKLTHYPFPGGGGGYDVVLGDFNGDGKLDLVTVNQYGDMYLLLGRGNGMFQQPPLKISTGEQWLCGLAGPDAYVTDLNGDGKSDLFSCGDGKIGIFLGNGDGTFQEAVYSLAPAGTALVPALGDFNADGKTDLLISELGSLYELFVLWGNGDGTFQPQQAVTLPAGQGGGIGEYGMWGADLNRDGLIDFIDGTALGAAAVYTQQ